MQLVAGSVGFPFLPYTTLQHTMANSNDTLALTLILIYSFELKTKHNRLGYCLLPKGRKAKHKTKNQVAKVGLVEVIAGKNDSYHSI